MIDNDDDGASFVNDVHILASCSLLTVRRSRSSSDFKEAFFDPN